MPESAVKEQFACASCGAGMQFSPESGQLKCAHCGQMQALIAGSSMKAHEFTGTVAAHLLQPITAQALQVTCTGCAAWWPLSLRKSRATAHLRYGDCGPAQSRRPADRSGRRAALQSAQTECAHAVAAMAGLPLVCS